MKNNTIIKSYCNLLLIVHLEDLIHEPFHLGWDLPTLRLPVPTHYHQFYALLAATHHAWLLGVLHFLELELVMLKGHVPWLVHRQFLLFFFLLGLGQIFLLLQLQRLRSNLIEHIVRLKAFRFLVLRNRGDFDLNLLLFNLLHFLLELKANADIRWKSGRSWQYLRGFLTAVGPLELFVCMPDGFVLLVLLAVWRNIYLKRLIS